MDRRIRTASLAGALILGALVATGSAGCDRSLDIGQPTVVNLGARESITGMLALWEGSILVAGRQVKDARDHLLVARFQSGGALDPGFGGDPIAGVTLPEFSYQGLPTQSAGYALGLQHDGRIIVAARAWPDGKGAKFQATRLLPDGKVDVTFGTGGTTFVDAHPDFPTPGTDSSGGAYSLAIGADDSIYLGGSSAVAHELGSGHYWSDYAIVHLTADGAPDPMFGENGATIVNFGNSGFVQELLVLDDGKLLVGGQAALPDRGYDMALSRLRKDGSLDPDFGQGGTVLVDMGGENDCLFSLARLPDGTFLGGGQTSTDKEGKLTDFAAIRFDDKGVLSGSFGTGGKLVTHFPSGRSSAQGMVVTGDGFWLGGWANGKDDKLDFAMARYTLGGALDPCPSESGLISVHITDGADDFANAMIAQPDKTPVLGGQAGDHLAIDRFPTLRCGVSVGVM